MNKKARCPQCRTPFQEAKYLYRHIKTRCLAYRTPTERLNAVATLKAKHTRCDVCDTEFSCPSSLKAHAKCHKKRLRPHSRPMAEVTQRDDTPASLYNSQIEPSALPSASPFTTEIPSVRGSGSIYSATQPLGAGHPLLPIPPQPAEPESEPLDAEEGLSTYPNEMKPIKRKKAECWCGSTFTAGQEKKHIKTPKHIHAAELLKAKRRNAKKRMRFDGNLADAVGRALCFRAQLISLSAIQRTIALPPFRRSRSEVQKFFVSCKIQDASGSFDIRLFADSESNLPLQPVALPDTTMPSGDMRVEANWFIFVDNARSFIRTHKKLSAGDVSSWIVYTATGEVIAQCNWGEAKRLVEVLLTCNNKVLVKAIALDEFKRVSKRETRVA